MRADTDSDILISEFFQLRNEISDLGEVVSSKHLTIIILDALLAEKYSTVKIQAIKDPDLSREDIEGMVKSLTFERRWGVHCD